MFLSDTFICPILGPLVPCFEFMVTSPLGFKARVGSALFILHDEHNAHSLKFISGATSADLFADKVALTAEMTLPGLKTTIWVLTSERFTDWVG